MIQQFQPKYDPSLNDESERSKSMNHFSQANAVPKTVNTIEQMPYTIVTKVTPIVDETNLTDQDKT